MGILWKCCLRALKENKIRTIVTILGVALATALITTVTCALSSTLESSIQYLKKSGDWHGRYVDVKQEDLKYFQENQSLEGVWLAKKLGSAYVNDEEDTALTVMAPEQSFYEHLNVRLTEGRWPEKEGEILLGADLRLNGKKLKPGDVVNLSVGENCFHDESYEDRYQNSLKIKEEKTYVVVGILRESLNYSAPTVMKNGRSCRSYDAYVFDENPRDKYDILIRYRKDALRRFVEVNQALLDITPEVYKLVYKSQMSNDYRRPSSEQLEQAHKRAADFQLNEILTVLEAAPNIIIKETDYVLIYMLVMTAGSIVFLLIILAGVFCIDNSFDVSFMERIRFYGMLASVGTTKRQKRLIVWMEAFVIGIFGIPLGILAGILFTDLLITIVNLSIEAYLKKMEITIALSVAWWGILISAILAMFMICLSAMGSATHASRIMPIEAIRNSDVVKKGKKKEKRFKTPKLIGKVFGIGGTVAWQNFKRSKVKYRATVSSIAISVALFLGMSFIRPLFQMAKEDIATYMKWNLEVLASGGFYEMLEFVKDNPEVERSVIMSSRLMSFKDKTYVDDNQKEHRTFYISALDDA
ncbi:MAG: ABC transporter permease, partial [Lachnospiraceae bacterium]|nr:ABC transporter permease [Lachnospiraceae bacterium]